MSRVALVTGGARGIGAACARQLAEAGMQVAVTYRSSRPDEIVASGILAVPCDVTDSNDVDRAFAEVEDKLGPIEVLISNAGITKDGLVLRMSESDFGDVLDANLSGGFRVAKRAVKGMMKGRWGRIVFISSVVGQGGQAGQANYAASKAGLVGLSRSLAKEFASRGITVNVVAPGPILTDMLDALGEERQAQFAEAVPLGRIGSPDEVAATVRFLASEQSGYITGAVIPVDGGLSMGA
jgi:3-oxoacyl-[acyl-carrier protein] reductase